MSAGRSIVDHGEHSQACPRGGIVSGTSRPAYLRHRVGQVALLLGASGQKHQEVRAAIAGFGAAACRKDDEPVTING